MRQTRYAIACLLALFGLSSESQACTVPKPGYGLNMDDLIGQARTIVLVRLRSSSEVPERMWTKYTLETVEVIKGKAEPVYEFLSLGSNDSDNDFAQHTAPEFWPRRADEEPIGRSEWPCCICGPDHSFRKDREYLYFPDKLGAERSAEVIRSKDDRWLQYVRSKVKAADRALQRARRNTRAPEPER
jgi:hypothetical protein